MSSQEQIDANRQNGALSNGPATPEGKAASSKNALKHGLLSREILLPNEDPSAFAQFSDNLVAALKPIGELESVLVDRIIGLGWRLRRLSQIEAGILGFYSRKIDDQENWIKKVRPEDQQFMYHEMQRTIAKCGPNVPLNLVIDAAVNVLKKRALVPEADTSFSGRAFIRDCEKGNSLSHLSRYESRMERSLFRTLHELERQQAARHGQNVESPQTIDIEPEPPDPAEQVPEEGQEIG